MSAQVKGWCPSAHRPMMSGDGLLVRVRPDIAGLDAPQVRALCSVASQFGNGMIDVTSRANLQLRGVSEGDHPAVLKALIEAGLVHVDPMIEARRILTVTPFWRVGDLTHRLATALKHAELPTMPDKMGVVLDTGAAPLLQNTPGDFRFELDASGVLILRAEGAPLGLPIEEGQAVQALSEIVAWFLESGGAHSGRVAKHLETTPLPAQWQTTAPAIQADVPMPGDVDGGMLFGVPFGQTDARSLETLMQMTAATSMRVTPWRMLFLSQGSDAVVPGFLNAPDPVLNVAACPGMPGCAQSTVETRDLARELGARLNGTLHVSGCAKGCARQMPADVTLVGRDGRFDLVKQGRPGDTPDQSGLNKTEVLQLMAHNNAL